MNWNDSNRIGIDIEIPDYVVTEEELSSQSYATQTYVVNYVDEHGGSGGSIDLSSYVSYSYLESKHYLDSVPNDYPTYAAISDMGYITANDIPIPDLSTYVSKTELSAQSYILQSQLDTAGYVTNNDLVFLKNGRGAVSSLIANSYVQPLGLRALAIGINSYAAGENAIAIGQESCAYADNSVTLGRHSSAYGWSSTCMGRATTVFNYGELATGCGNFSSSYSYNYPRLLPHFTSQYARKNTMFSVGIGGQFASYNTGRNAFEVRGNGDVFLFGLGGNTGQGDGNTLQSIINNMFSYNSSTGTLTISTL